MKKVKIFLASSIEDLKYDRIEIGNFFRQLNEIYLDNGVHFSLIMCEDYDDSIVADGKQKEYDREICESELVFFLFFRKVGDYTKHEFDIALESFKSKEKPKIITYFKYVNTIEEANSEIKGFMNMLDCELKHYYNTYGNIDTLKLGILMQIKLMKLDDSELKIQDGEVCLNGKSIIGTKNVPILSHETLNKLTQQKRELQEKLSLCRNAYLTNPSKQNEDAFFDASAELNKVSKQLNEVEKQTLEFITTVAEITSDGRILTYRQKEALKYYNVGDYDKAQAILEDSERENELQRAETRNDISKNEIQGYVDEDLLWIKTEKIKGIYTESVEKIKEKYKKVVALIEKYNLDKKPLYDYASFLYNQNDYSDAIDIARKLQWYYSNPSTPAKKEDQANLLILLGILYSDTQRNKESEEFYIKALEIRKHLCDRNPDAYEPDLARSYNNLGVLYSDTQRYKEAEEDFIKALEIRKRLCDRNPNAYEPDLAISYNNLGVLYSDTQRYKEAEEVYIKALEIRKRLCDKNPDAYEPNLAISYNNLGNLYSDTQRYKEAEEVYIKALEIRKHLCDRNPNAYEPDLAISYNNLGILYSDTQRYKESEESYIKALEIRKRLCDRNPNAYEPDLARSYNNLGNLYSDTQRYKEAEEVYIKALEIRKRLCDRNPDAYEPDLARSYYNLGILYSDTQRYKEAEEVYIKALFIYEEMEKKYPGMYSDLISSLKELLNTNLHTALKI